MFQVPCKTTEIRQYTFVLGKEDKHNNLCPDQVYSHSELDTIQLFFFFQPTALPTSCLLVEKLGSSSASAIIVAGSQ